MQIEVLQMEDIPQLLELYRELGDSENTVEQSEGIYAAILANPDYRLLVAKDQGTVVGTALGICCKMLAVAGQNFLVIEDVVVAERVRGQGVGRLLFEALDAFALESNCAYSLLVSSGFRKGAHAFYERIGYTEDVRGFRKWYPEVRECN